jgi:hypothetical protein
MDPMLLKARRPTDQPIIGLTEFGRVGCPSGEMVVCLPSDRARPASDRCSKTTDVGAPAPP